MDAGAVGAGPSSITAILLASTGEPVERAVIERAIELASSARARMYVVSIARVFGTALGLQHPGLYPTKREWKAQADIVDEAVRALRRAGFEAQGQVVATRHAGKAIMNQAAKTGCGAIVIGARPISGWRKLLGQDEVDGLTRRAPIPVHVVPLPAVAKV